MSDKPQPQPPPQQGLLLTILDRLLSWLDSAWKAWALAGLATLIALGYGGWLSRDMLSDMWKMSAGRPILKRSELPEMLKTLRSETGADIVALWSLNIGANAMNFEEGLGDHAKPWDFAPHRLPAIRDPVSSPQGLAELMSGQIVCRTPAPEGDGDLFNRRMVADKIRRLCIVPVPPAPNILVGMLLIAWIVTPDKSTEEAALGLARETASTMVSRWE